MFANDPNLYGLTYRDFPVRPPFLGTPTIPFENVPRFTPPTFGLTPWETFPRYVPPFYGMNPWETIPRYLPPQFGAGQPMFHMPQLPIHPYMQAGTPPFVPPMNFNLPFYGFYRPFGV